MSDPNSNYTTPQNQNKRQRSDSVSSLSTGISDVPTLVDPTYLSPVASLSETPSTVATVTSQMSTGQQEALERQQDAYTAYHTLYKKIHLEDMNIMIANQNDTRIYPNLFVFDEMDNNDKNAAKDGSIQAYKLNTNTDTFYPVIWDNNKFVSQDNLDLNQSMNSFYSSNNLGSLMAMENDPHPVVTSDSSTGSSYFDHKGGKRKLRRTSKKGKKRNAGSGKEKGKENGKENGTLRNTKISPTIAQNMFRVSNDTKGTLDLLSVSAYNYAMKHMEEGTRRDSHLPYLSDRTSAQSPLPILTEPYEHTTRSSSPYPHDTKPKNGGKRKSKKNIKRRNKKSRRKP